MTDAPYTGPERRSSTIVWEVGIARLETKLDALLASVTTLVADVNELERRVQVLEVSVARFDQLHGDIAARTPSPTSWPAVLSSVAALVALALVVVERIYR